MVMMFDDVVALNREKHYEKAVRLEASFDFAKAVTSAPLGLSEVDKVAREMPIVFTKDGPLVPVAQMGFRRDDNMFVGEEGKWLGNYTPAHVRRYPFVLGEMGSEQEYQVMVVRSALVDRTEGEPLFIHDSGAEGPLVRKAKELLIAFQKELQKTAKLCASLREYDVLVDRVLQVGQGKEFVGQVIGVQLVDWQRVRELDDATLADWVRSGLMSLIINHLNSIRFGSYKLEKDASGLSRVRTN
jgi:hypothetical protein